MKPLRFLLGLALLFVFIPAHAAPVPRAALAELGAATW
jgi:hypothetical protein